MLPFLYTLQSLGWVLYAGPMIAFAILIHIQPTCTEHFQRWGVGFGVSLTIWIYSSIAIQYVHTGSLYPDISSNPWIIAAFIMWISNIKLEIWTLDPIRKKNDISSDQLEISRKNLNTHLTFHALFIVTVQILYVQTLVH